MSDDEHCDDAFFSTIALYSFPEQVYYCIGLTKESLFKRTIRHFGPTTLRATICSSLLRLANIGPGDVVVDPMCGGGSIPLEGPTQAMIFFYLEVAIVCKKQPSHIAGALAYRQGFHLGGDIHEKAFARAGDNVSSVIEEDMGGKGLLVMNNSIDAIQMLLKIMFFFLHP